jgi:FixJ family two-component response regulator
MKPVWIVDDDKSIRWVLEKTLAREKIPFRSFASAGEALSELDSGDGAPQVLVSDIRMPGQSGLELLQIFRQRFPSLPVIIMTAYSDLDSAVSAFQGGAFEYLPKPFDVDQAIDLIRRAISESMHQIGAASEAGLTPEILGQAPAMQEVFRAIGRLSQSTRVPSRRMPTQESLEPRPRRRAQDSQNHRENRQDRQRHRHHRRTLMHRPQSVFAPIRTEEHLTHLPRHVEGRQERPEQP